MGKIKKGILGGVSGKVGTIVGSSWKGKAYIRSIPLHVKDPRTFAQLCQRKRFAIVMRFLKPLNTFLKYGYRKYTSDCTAMNAAMSYMMRNGCIIGEYPAYSIDYAMMKVSRGDLKNVYESNVTLSEGNATFTWVDNSDLINAEPTDLAMALLYNPTKDEAEYDIGNASRVDGNLEFRIPADWEGDAVEVYLAFMSADGKMVSDSRYIGEVEVN